MPLKRLGIVKRNALSINVGAVRSWQVCFNYKVSEKCIEYLIGARSHEGSPGVEFDTFIIVFYTVNIDQKVDYRTARASKSLRLFVCLSQKTKLKM